MENHLCGEGERSKVEKWGKEGRKSEEKQFCEFGKEIATLEMEITISL